MNSVVDTDTLKQLKLGVWVYFFLLIFEGALRKWIFPGFAEPLLVIRDPVAIWLLFKSLKEGFWRPDGYVVLIVFITTLGVITALLLGHGNIYVALYGFRITAIHFPIIFVIGQIFNIEDVVKLGRIVLWITLGMTLLVGIQFYSPQTAWINRGVGGDLEGSGFGGALGYFRVPGTFSFTNGLSYFYGLATAFIMYFWLTGKDKIPALLLIGATIALVIAIPLSISRTVLFQILVTIAFTIAIMGHRPKVVARILGIGVIAFCLMIVLKNFQFFNTASLAFEERFSSANQVEGGMEGVFVDRFLGGMINALTDETFDFWGSGLGLGTNAGAKIVINQRAFLISEGEWGRIIGEMGFVLGLSIILIRGGVAIRVLKQAWNSVKEENILPWILMSFGTFMLLQAPWAQPTTLGFSVLVGGLAIAAFQKRKEN